METFYLEEKWTYDHCVVIGTEKELESVFGKYGLEMEGYHLCATSAPRPDAMQMLKENGWGKDDYVVLKISLQ